MDNNLDALTSILLDYMQSDREHQAALVCEHPSLFVNDVKEALAAAQLQLNATFKEIQEASRAISGVADSLDLPGGVTRLQASEKELLESRELLYTNFAKTLSGLIQSQQQPQGPSAAVAHGAASLLPLQPAGLVTGPWSPAGDGPSSSSKWFERVEIVFHVLSYLPCEAIFMSMEYVSRAWMTWLAEAAVCSPFWLGCVQREYPAALRGLLETEGPEALLTYDWRSVAMLCVAEDPNVKDGDDEGAVPDTEAE
ncbi:hypothetical protein STCU_02614 [Strigomonas culicis]|nr:hypothetical protein STCU_02614 [Strigomonas culicis]|eukprot:EPY32844.1 hypothetical protein STCU_02614 [Strigomonas culicis]